MDTSPPLSDFIDWTIFGELLQMDEDEEGFSKSLITTFVEQLLGIFDEMDLLIINCHENHTTTDDQLVKLSNLGHYLKGSALALGLTKIQSQCERIQNYGNKIISNNGNGNGNEQGEEDELMEDYYNNSRQHQQNDRMNNNKNYNSNSNDQNQNKYNNNNNNNDNDDDNEENDNDKNINNDNDVWLERIKKSLSLAKLEFARTREILSGYFGELL